jgi:6,7-dimethyl-8-ribityllumazine synthase
MQNADQGNLQPFNASQYRVGIVVAQFNAPLTEALLASALARAKEFHIPDGNLTIERVAGSVEIPVVLKALAATKRYDALVALGAVVRGETDHYEHVSRIVSEGVLQVMMQSGVPVGFGVLTCDTEAQAKARLESGGGALAAALWSAASIRRIAA